jgi:putative transposase
MARKRHSDEDILKLLREIEVKLANGSDVQSACRGMGGLEKENTRLKKIVAELELDKLILKESMTYLKPRA